MLVPYVGMAVAVLIAGGVVAVALIALAAFCWRLDAARRELVAEIKARPSLKIRVGGD